ncbi:antitermination protein [Salmonella enterica]|nr:hypothetical protein [Salmonella enterica]EAX2861866.1 antitermination protein [Salmonella enterica]EAX2980462.1 antitermination protein [Salmonella enterica]EAY9619309.1 antitermination protein [Salmonella enterica]EBA3557812.1 antitermination protein [Salmonella enterica]
MNLESLPKYFSPKSMMPGAVPCGITSDTLTITDVMASLGLLTAKAAVGIELYLAKAGVLSSENIIAYIRLLAEQRAERHGALRKMEEGSRITDQNTDGNITLSGTTAQPASIATDGVYVVKGIMYTGDTRGQAWYMDMMCEARGAADLLSSSAQQRIYS